MPAVFHIREACATRQPIVENYSSKLIDSAVRRFFGVAAARQLSEALVLFRDHALDFAEQSPPRRVHLR